MEQRTYNSSVENLGRSQDFDPRANRALPEENIKPGQSAQDSFFLGGQQQQFSSLPQQQQEFSQFEQQEQQPMHKLHRDSEPIGQSQQQFSGLPQQQEFEQQPIHKLHRDSEPIGQSQQQFDMPQQQFDMPQQQFDMPQQQQQFDMPQQQQQQWDIQQPREQQQFSDFSQQQQVDQSDRVLPQRLGEMQVSDLPVTDVKENDGGLAYTLGESQEVSGVRTLPAMSNDINTSSMQSSDTNFSSLPLRRDERAYQQNDQSGLLLDTAAPHGLVNTFPQESTTIARSAPIAPIAPIATTEAIRRASSSSSSSFSSASSASSVDKAEKIDTAKVQKEYLQSIQPTKTASDSFYNISKGTDQTGLPTSYDKEGAPGTAKSSAFSMDPAASQGSYTAAMANLSAPALIPPVIVPVQQVGQSVPYTQPIGQSQNLSQDQTWTQPQSSTFQTSGTSL